MSGGTLYDATLKAADFVSIFEKTTTAVLRREDDIHVGATLCLKGWRVAQVPNWYGHPFSSNFIT